MSETTTEIEVRYDLCEFDDDRVLVIRAASRSTQYDIVITQLEHFAIHNNAYVIALVNLGPRGYVWNLPRLTGWHWTYLAEPGDGMNEITAKTMVQILNDVAARFER